jgi:hypothetical protein
VKVGPGEPGCNVLPDRTIAIRAQLLDKLYAASRKRRTDR